MNGTSLHSATLADALERRTISELKPYLALLEPAPLPTRKADLIAAILRHVDGESAVQALLERLESLQRQALAFALHRHDGRFAAQAFAAQHGRLPELDHPEDLDLQDYQRRPNLLRLLFGAGSGAIPADLMRTLRPLLPEPETMQLLPLETLPQDGAEAELSIRSCENEALFDLCLVLRLAEGGKLQVGEKTGHASTATRALLVEQLSGGDYYAIEPRKDRCSQEIGPIKAFAWPLLLQAGKLAKRNGKRLAPTPAGRAAAGKPAEALRALWQAWLKSTGFDEFSRVDAIKGQGSRGRVMAALAPRRVAVEAALAECPVGAWIAVDQLSRYMQAEGLDFEVCNDPWKLYVGDAHYGSLGYAGSHDWHILQFRYLLCLLFEYAAPLGLVDLAYAEPEQARDDFRDLWGADELEFLSRYDGLRYLRLTPLGAYCLGLSDTFQPTLPATSLRLSVHPGGRLTTVSGAANAGERLLLETWAEPEDDSTWRMNRARLLLAIEQGHDPQALVDFLCKRDDQPLPEQVEALIKECATRGRALKPVGQALLIACDSAATAETVANHPLTASLCQRAGDRHLVLLPKHEEAFRAALRSLGYGMAI
jgi:hypothetical protein